MGQQVVTELVIDSSGATAGASQFESAMGSAEAAARKTVGGMADLSGGIGQTISALGGLAALFTGGVVIAGLTGFIDQIVKANKSLADMQTMAKQTGLSLADFQGLQFGGAVAGLTPDQINDGLQKSAKLLNDASRNSNSLSKELAENGINIKNVNGQLISQNQLLGIAADLIKRAKNPGDANAIAEMLGFTKEWVPLLEQGSEAMSGLTAEARLAGAVLDDETIKRATEFDQQWRKSSVEFSSYMKSALLSLLPFLDDLIERAAEFVRTIDKDKIEKQANDSLKALADPLGIPNEGGIKISMASETEQALKDFNDESKTLWERIVAASAVLSTTLTRTGVEVIPPKDIPYPASQDPLQSSGYPKSGVADFNALQKAIDAADDAAGDLADTFSKVAAKDVANDQFDRAVITVKRHTDQLYADADALGLGAGALAKFRTEAQLTSAAEAAGLPLTAARMAQIKELGLDAQDAANDLAKLTVASQIDFSNKTRFLSPEDLQIATQLKGIYGNDVPAALASTEAAAMRVNNAIKSTRDAGLDFAKTFVQGLMQGKSGMDALNSAAAALASKLADKALVDLFSGNFLQAGVEAVAAVGSALFASATDTKQAKALQEAQLAWANMTTQITNFNVQARGFNLGPLTNELQQLWQTSSQLQAAAFKAGDTGGAAAAANSFNQAVVRIYNEFKAGPQTLTPLQTSMKAVNDEAAGLKQTLSDIGFKGAAATVDGIVNTQIDALTKQFNDTFISGLTARLNTAQGQSFLNDAANLLVQHQQDLAQAGDLGNDPTLLAQVAATFHSEAQKIVDDAGLVGTAFTDFTTQFPQLAGIVVQANQDMSASAKQLQDAANATAKSITDYVNGLYAGSSSTDSPTTRRAAAGTIYNTELALAQTGDAGAQARITTDAQNLLDAERAISASSVAFQQLRDNVAAQLLSLPAVQQTTDPAVQAMRDVLTAINIGNQALNVINATAGGTTSAVNDANSVGTLTNTILPAVNAGNAVAVAANLASYLNNIKDAAGGTTGAVNTSKTVLDSISGNAAWLGNLNYMQYLYSNTVDSNAASTKAALTGLFNQIDPTGTLATMLVYTGATQGYTAETKINTLATKGSVDANNTLTGNSNTILSAIQGLQGTANTQLVLLQQALTPTASAVFSTSGSAAITVSNNMVNALNKIVINTYQIAANTNAVRPAASTPGGLGVFASGGLITGAGSGTSDSIHAMLSNREFVIKNAAVEKFGVGFFEQLNAGIVPSVINDNRPINVASPAFRGGGNADVVAELRALREENRAVRAELQKLQSIVAAGDNMNAKATMQGSSDVVDAVETDTKKTTEQLRMNKRNQRNAA
jgi:hypothetical protein